MKTESQRIGHYELRQRLNQDNAGETWRAYDYSTQRTALSEQRIARWVMGIIFVDQETAGEREQICMLAIECVEGETLADYIQHTAVAGKMPSPAEIVQLFAALALALDSAHQHGIIHGNLKPTNILLSQPANSQKHMGTPLITDFGPVKFLAKKSGNEIPSYLAPEQVKGASPSARSDIYALGVLLYELYTGLLPFRGNRPIAVMMQHVSAIPTSPDLVNPGISPALAQVILRCLAITRFMCRFPKICAISRSFREPHHSRPACPALSKTWIYRFPRASACPILHWSRTANARPVPWCLFPSSR